MPASTSAWPSRPGPGSGPRRTLRGDSSGVSEVVGFLLTFGILSIMLVMSMYAFDVAAQGAEERAVALHAESAAARVAGVIVEVAVLAEQQGSSDPSMAYVVELPEELESYSYEVKLEPASGADPDRLVVTVDALDLEVTAPIFSAAAPTSVNICSSSVEGGRIVVLFDNALADHDHLPNDVRTSCGAGKFIFLGEA